MTGRPKPKTTADAFDIVRQLGATLGDVEAAVRYDGSPELKLRGCFMAGLATHPSAESGTLVVRADREDRELLLAEAPETYYLTDYYRKYPLVLARLSTLDHDTLRALLQTSWQLTSLKSPRRRRRS